MLHTLGGPGHLGEVRQPKLLLLLAYLALEGQTPRRTLSQLFWPRAERSLSNLSVALSTLRSALSGVIAADHLHVAVTLANDVERFLDAIESGDEALAAELYLGPFMHGIEELELGSELEEWVLATREFVAERYRGSLLRWAEGRRGEPAARLADAAYRVPGAPPADAATLRRLFTVLDAADHPSALDVRRDAEELGIDLLSGSGVKSGRGHASGRGLTSGNGLSLSHGRVLGHDEDERPSGAVRDAAPPLDRSVPDLPRQPHALIGREPERLEVHRLLTEGEARLVTLHGPGGIGKTSLALQVARDLRGGDAGWFPGGVAFVELEETRDAAELPFALARALGRTYLAGRQGIEALRAVLPAERTLLVLDNLEQVNGASQFLERMLELAPRLYVLSTSRELMGLALEVAFGIDGLAVPDSADVPGADSYDAVRLFLRVARRADAGFQLGREQLPDVVRICRAVGGSPLGIELAAAWVRAVPLSDLANEIEHDVDMLRRSRTTGPPRHASARASFERSWTRLEPNHRRSLAALSVFAGGFGLGDAKVVAQVSITGIARLVDAALLRVNGEGRYEQHPLVARFAREKLESNPEREHAALDRHAERFLDDLASRSADLRVLRGGVLEQLDEDFENVRAAWNHAVRSGRCDLVEAAAFPLMRYVDARARLQDGRVLFAAAAEALGDPGGPEGWATESLQDGDDSALRRAEGRALSALAWVAARLGDNHASIQAGCHGERLLEAAGDSQGLRVARQALASAHYRAGEYEQAQQIFEALVETASDDPVYRAELLGRLGLVAQAVGEYDAARERYLEALAANRRLANVSGVVTQLLNLGALDLNTHAPQAAGERFEEALRLAREHGYQQVIPVLLHNLANVACKAGRYAEARTIAGEALERVVASGERGLESGMLATIGWIEMEAGDLAAAEVNARRALEVATGIGDEPAEQTARVRLGQVMLAAGRLQDAVALLDFAAGHTATLTWARLLARRLREDVTL